VLEYVDQSSSLSRKWGFSVLCAHIAISLRNVLFSPCDGPDFWWLSLNLSYSTSITLIVLVSNIYIYVIFQFMLLIKWLVVLQIIMEMSGKFSVWRVVILKSCQSFLWCCCRWWWRNFLGVEYAKVHYGIEAYDVSSCMVLSVVLCVYYLWS